MMDIRTLIPKNKFDESGIEELKKLSFEQIKPIVPNLLEWLQDMNWPVASYIADILKPFINKITPEIVAILKSDDVMWKYWILGLIRQTNDPLILMELEKIVKYPSLEEIDNEVDIEAIEILKGVYKN
ncbi:DUF5071 domain-containing protein [Mucilaginibacter terrae]|uniref:DUF5071 domain-containing protein n=1 Tax=Mucilaginibacter terrae TaxID=1955052 RepID=UPI00289C6660|nr:DUF5071 domain-containing protein [Mucilaginibacter terrae]